MNALALVEASDHVCCRYRVRAFERALDAIGWSLKIEALARGPITRPRQLQVARRFDTVLLQRKLLNIGEFRILRRASRRLIFDLDDAVFLRDSFHPKGITSPVRFARFARIVRNVDAVIAGNDFLAARAVMAGASPEVVYRIPTCVEPGRYPARSLDRTGQLRLVWIGSSSTLRGLEERFDLWDRIGREVPGVTMRVICDRKPDFGALNVEFVRWSEATEGEALAGCDVGIAWTPDDLWSRGKCGLKVLQYLAASLPVVANPVGVHGEMIAHGRSGMLADSDDRWIDAVSRLADDQDLRERMGREARRIVERDYAVDQWASGFVEVVTGSSRGSPTRPHFDAIGAGWTHSSGQFEGMAP